jgi:superfamily II DNA helicase RecQ
MNIKVLTLKYSERLSGFDTDEIEDFVKNKEILEIRDHFFLAGGNPRLTIILTYNASEFAKEINEKKPDDSYKNYLHDEDWPLFKALKEWRNAYAKKKGVPPYILFDNTQLAHIAHNRPASKSELMKIEKIGQKKADEYWDELDRLLNNSLKNINGASAEKINETA